MFMPSAKVGSKATSAAAGTRQTRGQDSAARKAGAAQMLLNQGKRNRNRMPWRGFLAASTAAVGSRGRGISLGTINQE
jgi:hypothetical protein